MKTILILKLHYFTNFPIKSNVTYNFKKFHLTEIKPNTLKKKFCKNFFLLLIFLNFLQTQFDKKNKFAMRFKFFIKPNKQNIFNYLRAPYKNKLSRNQIYTPKYKLSISIFFSKNYFYKHGDVFFYKYLLNFLKKNLLCLESNIIYINKINVLYKSVLFKYWNYKNCIKYNK